MDKKKDNERILEIKTGLLKQIDRICEEHQIPYFAYANLLIGCVHYQDFIPGEAWREWDLGFLREDYDRLLPILRSYRFEKGIRFSEKMSATNAAPRRVVFLEQKAGDNWYHIRLCVYDHLPDDYYERQAFLEQLEKMEAAYEQTEKQAGKSLLGKVTGKLQLGPNSLTKQKEMIQEFAKSKLGDERANHLQSVVLYRSKLVTKDRIFPLQRLPFRDMMLSCPGDVSLWVNIQDEELARQIAAFQEVNLILLKKLDEICKKLDIGYFVCGGTMLGCIRHEGFIPWDDDADVGMLRADYDRFLEEAGACLDDRFFLQTWKTDPHCPYLFAKLRVNDSECITPLMDRLNCHHGIGLDIFPFDFIPEDTKEREKLQKKTMELAMAHRELFRKKELAHEDELFPPRNEEERRNRAKYEKMSEEAQKLSTEKTREAYLKTATQYNRTAKEQGLTTVASFIPSYTYISLEDLLPYGRRPFENIEVSVPKKPEVFLTMQYHDFMKLPMKHQQIGHKVMRWYADMDKIKGKEE